MRKYSKHSRFSFGLYKGYEFGLIFVVDPGYVEWCILNIKDFCVSDLNDLLSEGFVSQDDQQWGTRMIGEPTQNIHLQVYDSYDTITSEVIMSSDFYRFSEKAIEENSRKLKDSYSFY